MLLYTDSGPVGLGCWETLCGHSGISVAYEYGIVGSTDAILTNKALVDGDLAVNRKEEKH